MIVHGKIINETKTCDGKPLTQDITIDELYEDFSMFYCGTVHKSQGGEKENIVLFVCPCYSWKNSQSKRLLRTGISRAQAKCFIIGMPNTLLQAQYPHGNDIRPTVFLEEFNEYVIED